MTIPSTTRTVAALCVAALLAGGCRTSNDPDPPSPPESADDGDGTDVGAEPAALDADTAVGLFVAWWEVFGALPPTEIDDLEATVADRAEIVTVAGSAAYTDLLDRAVADADRARQDDFVDLLGRADLPLRRGDVLAEVLAIDDTGSRAVVTVCASQLLEFTWVTTGEPTGAADIEPPEEEGTRTLAEDTWQQWTVEAIHDDTDGWQLTSVTRPEPFDHCVPASIVEAVTERWQAYVDAHAAWEETGADGGELGRLGELITGEAFELHSQSEPRTDGGRLVTAGIAYDLELHEASRTVARGWWCTDGSRNSEAGLYRADGEFLKNDAVRAEGGVWELVDGDWLLAQRVPTVREDADEVPEEVERCF